MGLVRPSKEETQQMLTDNDEVSGWTKRGGC